MTPTFAPQTLNQFVEGVLQARIQLLQLLRVEPAFVQQLANDLASLRDDHAPHRDATEKGRRLTDSGSWRVHVLYNVSGRPNDMTDDTVTVQPKQFGGGAYPALRRLFDAFGADMTMFNITSATPGARLVEHTDPVVFANGTSPRALEHQNRQFLLRLHVPVTTSPGDFAVFGAQRRYYEPGLLYYFNAMHAHSAVNDDSADRIHIVLDMWLTEALWRGILDPQAEEPLPDGLSRLDQQAREAILARSDAPRVA